MRWVRAAGLLLDLGLHRVPTAVERVAEALGAVALGGTFGIDDAQAIGSTGTSDAFSVSISIAAGLCLACSAALIVVAAVIARFMQEPTRYRMCA